MTIYTWGYRGRTLDELRQVLREHGLPMVLDVRRTNSGVRIAQGWRREDLAPPTLNYFSLTRLGNYGKTHQWVRGPEADLALQFEAEVVCEGGRILLLCAEPDAQDCHRSDVAEAIAELVRAAGMRCEVIHL